MLKRALNVFVIGLVTVAATLLGATPASAADTWTVTPGGTVTIAGGPFTLYGPGPTRTVLRQCSIWSTDGQFRSGSGLPGVGIGTLVWSRSMFGGCTGSFPISIQPNWPINVDSYRSDWNWTFGTITPRLATFGLFCPDGLAATPFIYDNETSVLSSNIFGPVAVNVNSCILTLGRSTVSPRQTITSP